MMASPSSGAAASGRRRTPTGTETILALKLSRLSPTRTSRAAR